MSMKSFHIVDCHCDTLEKIVDHGASLLRSSESHITIDGLKRGKVCLQFFAAFIGSKPNGSALKRCLRLIDTFYRMLDKYRDVFVQILGCDDIGNMPLTERIGALLAVEGGEALEGEISNLRILHRLGVRCLTLTWNNRNEIADGVLEKYADGRLTGFGRQVVREMNRLGMLVDVSHLSERGFWDVLELSQAPIAATHSNAKSVCDHPRNLTDAQIIAIKENNGFIGINLYPPFLKGKSACLDDILRHIEHIASVAGIDILSFGADFDGIERLPEDIRGPEGYNNIVNALLRLNYSEEEVARIAYGNASRVLKQVLK
jgi:membrane dipeptidase